MQTGRVRQEHHAYEKHGSCALLAAIELLTGYRLAQVHQHRTKKEYTLFCQALAAAYPQDVKIRLLQDNLKIYDASAFYKNLPADEAQALAERFAFSCTPKLIAKGIYTVSSRNVCGVRREISLGFLKRPHIYDFE
jgi:hypothetical protein